MRWFLGAIAVCSLAGAIGGAPPTAKKDPPPGTLHSLNVTGNHRYSSEDILKQTGLQIGQHISASVIEEARQALQNLQVFSNVADRFRFTVNPITYDLTFEVTEIDQVFPMRFERLPISAPDIRDYLKTHVALYSDEIPGTEGVLNRYREAVQELVAHNDPSLKVKAQPSNDDPQQLTILFTTDEPPPTISQVKVTGNDAVDTGTILRAINSVAIGVPMTDTRMKQITDGAIRPVYAAHGYKAISFPSITTEPSKSDRGVIVTIKIKEGPLFKFGPIRFRGSGLDQDEVRSAINFKPGQTYDEGKVDDFRIDLQHRLRRRGFLDASVTTTINTDDANRLVNVIYNVAPGSIYNFAKLDIHGLDLITEPVVQQLWGEKPGKPFNPDYPDFFLKRVQDDNVFDRLADTSSDYTADDSTHTVVVHLYFKGGETKADKEKKKKEEEERRQAGGIDAPI